MTPLSPVDQLFLLLEKRQQPMHVGGLLLFSFPDDATPKYITNLAESMKEYTHPVSPFNRRLVNRFGQWFWEEDRQFDLEHHFRHEALPKPGRIRELLALVSAEHSNLMDRERPMWEAHLIEGVRGKRFALYTKAHHCMIDGIGAMRMMTRALSNDPNERDVPPIWAVPSKQSKQSDIEPASASDLLGTLSKVISATGKQFATFPAVAREISKSIAKSRKDSDFVSVFQAPKCLLNERITGSRRFAAQSYHIDRFKRIAKAFDATINDVMLAVCSSALRDYLISQHALPNQPLVAMVPVSIRTDDSESGNQITMILANLATHIADPSNRIQTIKASVNDSKERLSSMTAEEILNYTAITMAPGALNLLTGLAPKWQTFNVVISNVPGPSEPLYWNGAKLEGMYPVSIPFDRAALNITLLSYVDQLEFGLTACRRTLPSMQRLLDYLENGIRELEVAADIH